MNQNPQPVNQIKVGNKTQQDKLKVPKLDNKNQLTKTDGQIDRQLDRQRGLLPTNSNRSPEQNPNKT